MRKVILRMKEQEKYEIIKELVNHNGNKLRAVEKLGLSIRQINRLIKNIRKLENPGFVHGNRSKKPAKTLDKSISENIILLYRNKYQGVNFTHYLLLYHLVLYSLYFYPLFVLFHHKHFFITSIIFSIRLKSISILISTNIHVIFHYI